MVLNNTTQTHEVKESAVLSSRNREKEESTRNEESDRSKKTGFFAAPSSSSTMPGTASTRTSYVNGGNNSKTNHSQSETAQRGQCSKLLALAILSVVAFLATLSTYVMTSNQERDDFEKHVRLHSGNLLSVPYLVNEKDTSHSIACCTPLPPPPFFVFLQKVPHVCLQCD